MRTDEFHFNLPQNLIAQKRVHPYDRSKLLIVERKQQTYEDKHFFDIINYLTPNDVLVFNDTKVFKARLRGKKEILLLENISDQDSYRCIIKGNVKVGSTIPFPNGLVATVLAIGEDGERDICFNAKDAYLHQLIDEVSELPLPPYITKHSEEYQTIYADEKKSNSIAAPTAGFHFTNNLLERIKQKGVVTEHITLSVGIGTFRPVKSETIEDHPMHAEVYHIDEEVKNRLNSYKKERKRIIAVGTTSVRTLEDSADTNGILQKTDNETKIFIYPPYQFKFVDALITNFHLPQSTLIMLVSAFGGKDFIFSCYQHAIDAQYRFYSFGDAMFIQ